MYEETMTNLLILYRDGGRIHAPLHQITISQSQEGYLMTLFSFGSDTTEVPKELVDEEHPVQFKPCDSMELYFNSLLQKRVKNMNVLSGLFSV